MSSVLAAPPAAETGLTAAEVAARVERGAVNRVAGRSSRPFREILRANLLTFFNGVIGALLVITLVIGPVQDAIFGIVPLTNALIGIVQELRAKRALDRLTVLIAQRARVLRDGAVHEIPAAGIVTDDLVELARGDQVAVDGAVVHSDLLEVDESLLTGEAAAVTKHPGDEVRSGSFVVAGSGRMRVTEVGEAAYGRRLAVEAQRYAKPRSDLGRDINRFLHGIAWLLPPLGALLVVSQLGANDTVTAAMRSSVAAMVAFIPQGLVLLTSIALAVAVVRLSRRRVLLQDLSAVEMLARVDTVCIDKTGTLTDGRISVAAVEPLGHPDGGGDALSALARVEASPNPSMRAVAEACPEDPHWDALAVTPFSSVRGWSSATFAVRGTWVLGAPEVLASHLRDADAVLARAELRQRAGERVLVLARADESVPAGTLPRVLTPSRLVTLREHLRPDAPRIVGFLQEQGTRVLVISGDSALTAAAVAEAAGVDGAAHAIDARTLPDDPEALADVLEDAAVFGRVDPHTKREMVRALQRRGRVVAMTGDGVNDVLAVKEADVGIAMGSGSAATRAVARVVLVDSSFAALPRAIAEGRRAITNLERVARLFLTKTAYAMMLAIAVGLRSLPFPVLTRQMTLVDSFTVGIPAFFLALAPARAAVQGAFVRRTLLFALPVGAMAAAVTFTAFALAVGVDRLSEAEARTVAVLALASAGIWIVSLVARPLNAWRLLLLVALAAGLTAAISVPMTRQFFGLDLPQLPAWSVPFIALVALVVTAEILARAHRRRIRA